MVAGMAVREYNLVFVGGGLAALLLLRELEPVLPDRVVVVDPYLPRERPTVHWS
jgi:lycopene beta-cyclase